VGVQGVQTADEEMRTDQGKVKRGHKFVKAQWLSLLEALSDGGLRYSAPAGAIMDMPLDAVIYEDLDDFVTGRRTYVMLKEGGVDRLTQAVATLRHVG